MLNDLIRDRIWQYLRSWRVWRWSTTYGPLSRNLRESWPDFPRVGRILHNRPVLCFTINKYNITQPICVYRTRLTIPAIQAHKFAVAVPRWKNRRLLLYESGIDYVNTENLIVLFGTKKKKVLGFGFSKVSEFRTRDEFFFSAIVLNLLPKKYISRFAKEYITGTYFTDVFTDFAFFRD